MRSANAPPRRLLFPSAFIQFGWNFSPKTLSSKFSLIPKQFHPKTFSSENGFTPKNLCKLDLPLPGPPSPGPRKISLLSRHIFHYVFPLLGGLLVGIVGAVQGRIPQKVRVRASLGPFCETSRGLQVSPFLGPRPSGPFNVWMKLILDESVIG